ncbi:YopX family protein [Effusibacillus dendaii]|uniref:YopX protein domain-containing protein n=1 Tax=Effusibacillus dendaii TaxID=2743772 RepID=A0A7I8D8M5_9BACL|nr:YopX family protein [Effusibacillus dendaii]BCJ86488.1 hypothetical protein skT53_14730 [Effusibacillus dendaii]
MREIKFRAWDSKGWMRTDFSPSMIYDVLNITAFDLIWNSPDFVKMQYTGLKDRNGKEIYEGDILRDDETGLNLVVWDNGAYWIRPVYDVVDTYMEYLSDYNEVCEIIGNIYENPELLSDV